MKDALFERSDLLEQDVLAVIAASASSHEPRVLLTRTLLCLSLEHGNSMRQLLEVGNSTSGLALLRLQFESLLKAFWCQFAATPDWIQKLTTNLDHDAAAAADSPPSTDKMLGHLVGRAPDDAVAKLREFRQYSWKPLNSFVHSGLHALDRRGRGFPPPLLRTAVTHSNGLTHMAGNLLIVISGNPATYGGAGEMYHRYRDILPALPPQ